MNHPAIGGYFELELPAAASDYHAGALRLQSARAALLLLLQQGKPSAVWLPWYLCQSMLEPLQACGIAIRRYALDAQLQPAQLPPLASGEWLLYVNYFGLCDAAVERLLAHYPAGQLIIDQSQAFYSPARPCLANIYSPRKFFGVPDGGYLSDLAPRLAARFREGGALLRPLGNTIYVMPPYCTDADDLALVYDLIGKTLDM